MRTSMGSAAGDALLIASITNPPTGPAASPTALPLKPDSWPTVPSIARIEENDAGLVESGLDRSNVLARGSVVPCPTFLIAISETPVARSTCRQLMSICLEIGFANALRWNILVEPGSGSLVRACTHKSRVFSDSPADDRFASKTLRKSRHPGSAGQCQFLTLAVQ
jgi:hypothetical protein